MPLDNTLYVTTEDGQLTIIHHVTDYRLGVWPLWQQTYRDVFQGGEINLGTTTPTATVPAYGPQGLSPAASGAVTSLIFGQSDDLSHTSPRAYISYESGYFVAQDDAVIPEAVPLRRDIAVTFTAAVTDICTSTGHGFQTGDVVTVSSTGTLPTTLVSTQLYQVAKIDDNTFKLRVKNGAIVDITAVGTGTHTIVLVESANPDVPTTLPTGVRFFPMYENPRLSSSDPRIS
jgi:hypothetical protein